MSMTPPGPPLPPVFPSGGNEQPAPQPPLRPRSKVVIGFLIGLVVIAVVCASIGGWLLVSEFNKDDSPGSTAQPSPSPSATESEPLPETDPALAAFYEQSLAWRDCGRNECAQLRVPLDYEAPEGAEIEIAVLKVPASRASDRIGALVVNPGGPGGSGVNFAAAGSSQFGRELTQYFDIVGFDPRGVGASNPLKCLSTQQLDEVVAFDPDPDSAAEVAAMDALLQEFGQGCLDKSGDIARHMSTKEAARDMDILRAALGQARLDYLGSSYGTFLGATYAELFPTHVGRFVLDGAIDPSLSNAQLSLQQSKGFETALRAYIQDCIDQGNCFLGDSVDAGTRRIRAFLDQLDAKPISGDGQRVLTEGLGMYGIWMPLYLEDFWPLLTDALKDAIFQGRGAGLLQLADYYTSRGTDGYDDNSIEALYAVNCLDHNDYIESSQVPARIAQFERASPTFGRTFAYSLSTCANWPIKSGERTVALTAEGAPPIVVIGTTRDPATPLVWAQAMAEQLESGRLITRDGDGHTGFQRGSDCVDTAVESWLIEGKAPPVDLLCN